MGFRLRVGKFFNESFRKFSTHSLQTGLLMSRNKKHHLILLHHGLDGKPQNLQGMSDILKALGEEGDQEERTHLVLHNAVRSYGTYNSVCVIFEKLLNAELARPCRPTPIPLSLGLSLFSDSYLDLGRHRFSWD